VWADPGVFPDKSHPQFHKTYGNIVCFRDLWQTTDEAIVLFGENANGICFEALWIITTAMRMKKADITPAM
jgi:Type I site-specific restriction-modification system, R (restriction) subunit and related helicases